MQDKYGTLKGDPSDLWTKNFAKILKYHPYTPKAF